MLNCHSVTQPCHSVVVQLPGTASLTARSPRTGAGANAGKMGGGGVVCVCGGVRAAVGPDAYGGPDITGASWLDVMVTQRVV